MPLAITRPTDEDRSAFLAAVGRSGDLHAPWVSPPADAAAYDRWLASIGDRRRSWLVRDDDHLVGVVNANEIVGPPFQSTYLGYYGFAGGTGRGRMTRGLGMVLTALFDDLGLHRAEANIQPGNEASRALVQRLGFRQEGFSPDYLHIAGAWRDHERWAILSTEWTGGGGGPEGS